MKNPPLPTRLTILGQKWTVRYVPNLRGNAGGDTEDFEKVSGLSNGPTRTIHVCTTENTTPEQMHSTLLHEVMHSILYVAGLQDILGEKNEEAIVVALEHGLEGLVQLRGRK